MSDETIEAALQLGIALGKEEKTAPPVKAKKGDEEETYQEKVTAIFNVASGFTKGLEKLRDMKGSTFTFTQGIAKENDAVDVSEIIYYETNVPGENNPWSIKPDYRPKVTATISIPREGYNGGCFGGPPGGVLSVEIGSFSKENMSVPVTSPQAVEKALIFIAKQAAKRGLIS